MSKKYEYAWVLYIEHSAGASSFMLFKTERRAISGAKEFDAAKGWKTRIEMLVLN